mgnify:CR=1 FL=1
MKEEGIASRQSRTWHSILKPKDQDCIFGQGHGVPWKNKSFLKREEILEEMETKFIVAEE